jgi:2-oxoglutarate/2-oxoacid ferredoxin oxidoreductase subunit beta
MNPVYEKYIKKEALPTLFCPGCGNGIIQMAAIHAIDKAGIKDDVACVSGIGCSSWIPCYLDLDVLHTLHGRSLAFAQGLKLARPEKKILVFTGDGDCLAIGGNHLIHSAARNIDLTVVMVNNRIYGMTGGQKSPSSPVGMKTKTSPAGNLDEPIDGCKLVEAMGATYVARWTAAHPVQLEHAISEGMKHHGFAFIEVLSQCPIQGGSAFGGKTTSDMLKNMKESCWIKKPGEVPPEGKTEIGLLVHRTDRPEYTDQHPLEEMTQPAKTGGTVGKMKG